MPFFRSRPAQRVPSSTKTPTSKTLADLERELEVEAQNRQSRTNVKRPSPSAQQPARRRRLGLQNLLALSLFLGLPIGLLWVANLPYAPVRRPVAQAAPILLLPSYIRFEQNYRAALSLVAQAEQLLDQATSFSDVDLGRQKVNQAQGRLDQLPIGFLSRYPSYSSWWYDWRFSRISFDQARSTIGRLEAQVFQEENAQTVLLEAEQRLETAKQRYSESTSPIDQGAAIADWQQAIDQLNQLPSTTLAGAIAQQKLPAYERDFGEVTGRITGNLEANTLIQAARGFGWQAAKAAANPPHSEVQWRQIAELWEAALIRLERVPEQNLSGYAEAQSIAAEYQANLATVRVKLAAEVDSVDAFQRAQRQIADLQANAEQLSRGSTISRLQRISDELENVQSGTTVYLDAQSLLLSAQNKLNQIEGP